MMGVGQKNFSNGLIFKDGRGSVFNPSPNRQVKLPGVLVISFSVSLHINSFDTENNVSLQ